MKKSNLFLVTLMALIVMSCSKDETTMSIPQEGNAIEFGTYLGRNPQTRGAELTTANIANFGIMAAYTGQGDFVGVAGTDPVTVASPMNFMYNQLVTGTGSSWSYTPVKYWPTTIDDKISFFAYAPHSSTATSVLSLPASSTPGTPTVTYTVPADPTAMVDFVAGVVMNRKRTLTSTETDKVNFSLKHELTRVAFQAKVNKDVFKTDDDAHKTKINIKSATFDADAKFYSKGVYTFATVNSNRGTWAPETPITYSIANILNTSEATNMGGYTESGILLSGTDPVSLFTPVTAAASYLFLIPPQGATGLDESNEVSITFEYDIVTVDGNLSEGHSVTPAKKTVKLPAGTLKQGVAYNYTFTFNVDEVVVTATVDPWDTSAITPDIPVDYTHPI